MEDQHNIIKKDNFNILIVDDRKENLLALENLLDDQLCTVLTASSGQEALRILLDYEIFLILMDVQMPEMDGFETADLIRKNKRTMHIPIIFITAIGKDQEYIFKGYQSGAVDYLLKPINPEILKRKIGIFYELHQQKQLLAEKNSELKRMFYIASHDLRSPLVNIHGFSNELNRFFNKLKQLTASGALAENFKKEVNLILDHEIPNALEYINSSVRIMDNLLKGLLKISRLGEVVLNKQTVDVNQMVSEIIDNIQYLVKDKNIKMIIEDLPACHADNGLINQVFSNLINNAVKYNQRAGDGYIKITGSKQNYHTIYSIKDNGIGIPESDKDRIFDLFHRVNPDSEVSGEGIGLTAVKLILERHNGKIWMDSVFGEGTTFYIALPVTNSDSKSTLKPL